MKPFHELVVVEMAGAEAGAYAGKLFADLGARVIKVEPPGGDPRGMAGVAWGDAGTTYRYLNTSKEIILIDAASTDGARALDALLSSADVVIESSSPEPLHPLSATFGTAALVRTYVSPFGLSGPYARWRSTSFTDEAIGGHLFLTGSPDREPLRRPGLWVAYQAALHAFIGSMAALLARESTGHGQTVDISHIECLAGLHQHTTAMWTHGGFILHREGNHQTGYWHPIGPYACKDGFVYLCLPASAMVEPFLHVAGLGDLLDDPRFADDYGRATHKDEFDAAIRPWLMAHTMREIIELGESIFVAIGPISGMSDVLDDAHLHERAFWSEVDGPSSAVIPRGPFRVSGHPFRPGPRRSLDAVVRRTPAQHRDAVVASVRSVARGPLDGIRVLDLTRVWAGPLAARMLADLGADVIVVEMTTNRGLRDVPKHAAQVTHLYADNELGSDPWNRMGNFNEILRNRRGITLDLRDERCRSALVRLIETADVIIENFSPRVMPQLGFDDAALRAINPRIIHVAMPGFGRSGPGANRVAYGPMIEAAAGLVAMTGYPGRGPHRTGVAWPDAACGLSAAAGCLVALWDRDVDPGGVAPAVEAPMIEAMCSFVGEELLAAQVRGSSAERMGNRDRAQAPQGCYPCAGLDRWIAITVATDREWRDLCGLATLPARFGALSLAERTKQHDAIDRELARWTRTQTPNVLMAALQANGIAALKVSDARDLIEDPHLADREYWARIDHPAVGPRLSQGCAVRLSDTPPSFRLPAPLLGQHNREVLRGEAGIDGETFAAMEADGVICSVPPRG